MDEYGVACIISLTNTENLNYDIKNDKQLQSVMNWIIKLLRDRLRSHTKYENYGFKENTYRRPHEKKFLNVLFMKASFIWDVKKPSEIGFLLFVHQTSKIERIGIS